MLTGNQGDNSCGICMYSVVVHHPLFFRTERNIDSMAGSSGSDKTQNATSDRLDCSASSLVYSEVSTFYLSLPEFAVECGYVY